MDEKTKREWVTLAERLSAMSPDKFDEVIGGLRDLVEAQEIITRFDHQLFLRGRPRKQYIA